MTKDSLMLFLKRILECGSEAKSLAALQQLKEILELQNAGSEFTDLVQTAINSLPEAKISAKSSSFTEQDLEMAAQRAKYRRARELYDRSRCG